MKCPNCQLEFGYLNLPDVKKDESLQEFACPQCGAKLNNSTIRNINKKVGFYFYGAAGLFVGVMVFAFVTGQNELGPISKLILVGSAIGLPLGYMQVRKLDSGYYHAIEPHEDT